MLAIFKKKWFWITAVFLIINIAGLLKIISLIDGKQGLQEKPGIWHTINKTVRGFLWQAKDSKPTVTGPRRVYEERGFEVKSVKPYMSGSNGEIGIRLSDDINLDDIKGYIAITPEVNSYIETTYYGVEVKGDFKPGEVYQVEVLKGMPSAEGKVLEETFKAEVVMPDYSADVDFESAGMYLSLEGNQLVPVNVMNVDALDVKIHRVYDNNIVYLLNNMSSYSIPDDLGVDVFKKEIKTGAELNTQKQVLVDLKEILSNDSHGLFFMKVSDADESSYKSDTKLLLTTDIGILAKQSEAGLVVWLNTLSSTEPVAGAIVKVFSQTNQQILEGTSDEQGFVYFKDVDWAGDRKPFVITASTDSDLSFIEAEKCALSETVFDIEGRPYLSAGYEGFVYSDRGVYRPGEVARLRAIIRGVGVEVPGSFPVVFDIKKPDGMRFDKVTVMLSSFGAADVDISLPDYALTGGYQVSVKLPGSEKAIGSYSFSVEEFIPDRMKVEAVVPQARVKTGEMIPVKVKAEHLFGAPAAGRLVELKYVLKPVDFEVKKFSDFSFSDETVEFMKKTVSHGFKDTNEAGEAEFEVKIAEDIRPPSALNAVFVTTVKELGGRAVTSYSNVDVDAYPYYVGIRKTNEGYAQEGEDVGFDYVVLSSDGTETVVDELEVEVCKIIWNTVLKKDQDGRYRYVSDEKEECVYDEVIKTETPQGTFSYKADFYGSYIVRLKGKGDNAHTASLKFHVSGWGYQPWAMERPDRIDLELDKKSYTSGEEARLMIKSPFKGKALITISKDEVLSTQVVALENETQEIPIAVTDELAPNAYVSVTVIKPVIPGEKWSAHRAYGIIPLMMDNSAHQLDVQVKAPQSMLPRKSVDIALEVKNKDGMPQSSEVSVALVDEGVLRLTGFKTPDPYEFFFGKRRQDIQTMDLYSLLMPEIDQKKIGADSSPSAGKGVDFDPRKHMNPVSAKRVKPVALWKSGIVTDAQGKATVTFDVPQFSGNLKVMVVSAGDNDFGSADADIKVAEPVMIKPTLPRFLSSGDTFMIPVPVFNTSGSDGKASITIEVSDGFEVISQKAFDIDVKDKTEGFARFELKAPLLPGKAHIKISASLNGHDTFQEVEIPVRPMAPFTSISGAGMIKAPADETLRMPDGWLKGTAGYALSVVPLPGIKLAGGLKFLMEYPYGCIEQTTSTVFPLLYLKDVAKFVESKSWSGRGADNYIQAGIKRILSMQTYSGGFSYWPGYKDAYPYGSVYATDFLIEADRAGYVVPKFEKDVALDYLEKVLSGKEEDYSLELKAYAAAVLAKAGRVKSSWIRRLQEKEENLPVYARYHLALALAYLGDDKSVSQMLGKSYPEEKVQRETGGSLNSYTKQNAVALSAYMDVDPENEMVPILVKRVESSMEEGRWGTTQDNAVALLALGKYARYIESQDKEYSGSVMLGDQMIAGFDNASPALIKDKDLGGQDIRLSVQGRGNVYYYWNASGVPLEQHVEETDVGLRVRRRFLDRSGNQINKNDIKQGETVVVELSVEADLNYENIVIADMLPAGFEIENPRIETRDGSGLASEKDFMPDHIDIRDDRFLIFTDMPSENKFIYRYVTRAVTQGNFILPPVSAECMYDPSIKSVSGQGRVIIH